MELLYILKERHGRGNKELARIVLPVTPRVGELFKVMDSGRVLEVKSVTVNLWPSGKNVVIQTAVREDRPYGDVILGRPEEEEQEEVKVEVEELNIED